jgi:hypothetical protein
LLRALLISLLALVLILLLCIALSSGLSKHEQAVGGVVGLMGAEGILVVRLLVRVVRMEWLTIEIRLNV